MGLDQRDEVPWIEQNVPSRRLRVGVIAFPSLSNFTDFDPLLAEPSVALKYFHDPSSVTFADVIVLPGSKQTVDDLHWLRDLGFVRALKQHASKSKLIVGICGGFQMLGKEILDPAGMESMGSHAGLGLLPISTTMACDKVTFPAHGMLSGDSLFGQSIDSCEVSGYEIHLGTTEYLDGAQPFASIVRHNDGAQAFADGCVSKDGRIVGTYLHGLFDHDAFRHAFLRSSRASLQMTAPTELVAWSERRRQQLDLLADAFGNALDLDAIFGMVDLPLRADRPHFDNYDLSHSSIRKDKV